MIFGAAYKKNLKFDIKEDTLTSSVFGILLHLPSELFWTILRNSSVDVLPSNCGKILDFQFWPHWDSKNTSNSNFVEPDLFIRFENFDLIIEAKRWDNNQQYLRQWENELKGYANEFFTESEEKKDLYFFAVGGNHHLKTYELSIEKLKSVKIYRFKWSQILSEVLNIRHSIDKVKELTSNAGSILRILDTIIIGFRLHGFSTGEWFEMFDKISVNSYPELKLWNPSIWNENNGVNDEER